MPGGNPENPRAYGQPRSPIQGEITHLLHTAYNLVVAKTELSDDTIGADERALESVKSAQSHMRAANRLRQAINNKESK
jgi:hypothetical protein